MAEQNQEITYIPYGQDEISQQDLMTNLANGVSGYLDSKRWARKDKYRQAWLNAYQNIINAGLTGASNESGIWTVNHRGEAFPLESMSNIDREMYQDAAWYIQQQMARMTPRKKEEETKKEDLEKYGNFGTNLMNQMLKDYGNNAELFKDSEQGWDAQDARGADGLRGTANRKAAMIKALSDYRDSLNDKDFDFEGTSFKDKADLQTKIQAAIDALGTDEETDDLPAFNALGIPYRTFFSNGGNDPYTKGDYTGTYSGYNEYLAEQNEAKQKAEQEKLKQQRANQWKSFRSWDFSKFAGRPLTSEESDSTYLDNLFAKGKWTADEQSQIVSAFKLAEQNDQLVGLSKEELAKLPSTWKNRGKYLKRINGLNTPFYYDTLSKQFKLFNNGDLNTKTTFQEVLDKNNPEKKKEQEDLTKKMSQDKYLANTEWTPDKTRELIGIAADVASVINPEPISAGIMALGGTGLRTWNRIFDKDGFTLSDVGHTILDTGLSALGAIPIVGDAALSARILGKLQKASGWLGAIFAAGSVPQAAKAAWNKVINGQDMTVDDWRAIGNVIMGFTQARRMQLNNSAGKVIQRGETINENSPLRVQKTSQHFNKESWNIKQKGGQEEIKSSWYKKAWNYFKDPYAKPKVEPKEKSEIVKQPTSSSSKVSSRKITPEKISKLKTNIKKQFGDIDLSNLKVKHGTIELKGNKIEVGRVSAVKVSGNSEKVKQLRESTRKLLDKELDKAKTNKEVREVLNKIRKAKELGWYKQGGNLDNIIEDFLKKQ